MTTTGCMELLEAAASKMNKLNLLDASVSTLQKIYEPRHEISNNVVCATSKGSEQPAHTSSLIRAFAGRLNIL